MVSPLANSTYRRLFAAQVTALIGTGLSTVALALLAHDLAGGGAGAVLDTALALMFVAYDALFATNAVAFIISAILIGTPRSATATPSSSTSTTRSGPRAEAIGPAERRRWPGSAGDIPTFGPPAPRIADDRP